VRIPLTAYRPDVDGLRALAVSAVVLFHLAPGTLPGGWPFHTIWQYSSTPIDQDRFNGDMSRLQALANG